MTRRLAPLVALGVLVFAAPACGSPIQATPAPPAPVRCTEDADCWECDTMGNGICGSIDLVGPPSARVGS